MSELLRKINTTGPLMEVTIDVPDAQWVGDKTRMPVTATPAITGVIAGGAAAVTAEATQNTGPESVEELEDLESKDKALGSS